MTVCKIQRLRNKYWVHFVPGLCPFPLILSANTPHQKSLQLTCRYASQVTNISCYDIISIFHSLMQLNVPKMCHKTVGNLRFRPFKRRDCNHAMWNSVPCILNTRLCRPARRNIVSFLSPATVHRKIIWILMSVFHIKYIYFTETMCKILILVSLVIKSVSLNAKLNLCASYCIAISIQYGIN